MHRAIYCTDEKSRVEDLCAGSIKHEKRRPAACGVSRLGKLRLSQHRSENEKRDQTNIENRRKYHVTGRRCGRSGAG